MANTEDLDSKNEADETAAEDESTQEQNEADEESVDGGDESQTDSPEDNSEDEGSSAFDDEGVDYKAELDVARKQLVKAEKKIVKLKRSQKEEEDSEDEDSEEGETPDSDNVSAAVQKGVDQVRQEILSDVIEEALEDASDNPDERELIRFHYENTIRHSGYSHRAIAQDIMRAKLIANEKRSAKETREMKEALKSRRAMSGTGRGTNQDRQPGSQPSKKYSQEDLEFMKKRGIDPKNITN